MATFKGTATLNTDTRSMVKPTPRIRAQNQRRRSQSAPTVEANIYPPHLNAHAISTIKEMKKRKEQRQHQQIPGQRENHRRNSKYNLPF